MRRGDAWARSAADRPCSCWPTARSIEGHGIGAERRGRRRGLLQHRDDRLPGDPDRPVLCRPDRHLHLPAHRQCRRQRRGHRDRQHGRGLGRARLRAQDRHHRARRTTAPRAQLRRVAEGARHRRHRRHRHARADRAHPRRRACRTRSSPTTATATSTAPRCVAEARAWPGLVGMDLAKDVTTGQTYTWDETSWAWGEGYGRRDRRRSITSSPSTTASSATSCACSPTTAAA